MNNRLTQLFTILDKFLRGTLPISSLIGIAGSFYLSVSGEIPCPYCLTARYSLLVIFILSIISLFIKKNYLYFFTTVISFAPVIASLMLIINDYKISGSEICFENGSVHCTSPLFLGIHVSIYALLVGLCVLFQSIIIIALNRIKNIEFK